MSSRRSLGAARPAQRRAARLGTELSAAIPQDAEPFAPVVARLAGT
jgi:hypothetical protein